MQNKYYYDTRNGVFMKEKVRKYQPGDLLEYIVWDSDKCKEVWKGCYSLKELNITFDNDTFEFMYPSNYKELGLDIDKERIKQMAEASFIPHYATQAYEPREYFNAVVKSVFGGEE